MARERKAAPKRPPAAAASKEDGTQKDEPLDTIPKKKKTRVEKRESDASDDTGGSSVRLVEIRSPDGVVRKVSKEEASKALKAGAFSSKEEEKKPAQKLAEMLIDDDDSQGGNGESTDKNMVFAKILDRHIPRTISFPSMVKRTCSAAFGLASAMDDCLWFYKADRGGGSMIPELQNLRDHGAKKIADRLNLLQNVNNVIQHTLQPFYQWVCLTEPINILHKSPVLPIVVLLPPGRCKDDPKKFLPNKFHGFALVQNWIYDAQETISWEVTEDRLVQYGYLEEGVWGDESESSEEEAEKDESPKKNSIMEDEALSSEDKNAEEPASLTPVPQQECEPAKPTQPSKPFIKPPLVVAEGVKHYTVVINGAWVTSMATEKMADLKEGGEPTIPTHIETGSRAGTTQVHSNTAHRGSAAPPRGSGWGATPAPSNRRSSHGSHH